jgi:hypothetical protein
VILSVGQKPKTTPFLKTDSLADTLFLTKIIVFLEKKDFLPQTTRTLGFLKKKTFSLF